MGCYSIKSYDTLIPTAAMQMTDVGRLGGGGAWSFSKVAFYYGAGVHVDIQRLSATESIFREAGGDRIAGIPGIDSERVRALLSFSGGNL